MLIVEEWKIKAFDKLIEKLCDRCPDDVGFNAVLYDPGEYNDCMNDNKCDECWEKSVKEGWENP